MSWESLNSRDYFSKRTGSGQLSATALLSSPDGSRHPLDLYELTEEFPGGLGLGGGFDGGGSGGSGGGGGRFGLSNRVGGLESRNSSGGRRAFAYGGFNNNGINSNYYYARPTPPFAPAGLWNCLIGCSRRIDQTLARRSIEQGLRLYNQHKQQAAVAKWKSALKRIRKRSDKFILLGYLYQAYMDWGKYRESVELAHRQLNIAEEVDSPNLRAEAYLNLARTHERMGGLDRALACARHSLYNECDQCRTAGQVQITLAGINLELAEFTKALQSYQQAHAIAHRIHDPALELQVYVGLSELFGRLQDADRASRYASKAYDLSRNLDMGDLNSRYHRAALLQMATALRKQGELGDAHDYCTEATRLSLASGDQFTYAKSIRIMGDIYRKKSEIGNAYQQYESAMKTATKMGDRLCQMEAMDGAARCLEALRLQHKICNCRPLEFNSRLLEVAIAIGAKLMIHTVRIRLCRIYQSLGDDEHRDEHASAAQTLEEELELHCGVCDLPFGYESDSLEALPCAHILHARCAHDLLRRRDKKKKRSCPECERSVSSKLYLHCNNDNDLQQSTFSLSSLNASSSV